MKLSIEIEISPEEIPLATELLRTIRALTDHVKTREIGKLLQGLLIQLQDSTKDVVVNEICMLLKECSSETVIDDFNIAFIHSVLPDGHGIQSHNIQPFMLLLRRLPEPIKTKTKDILGNKVLKHFMIGRPSNTNRSELLTHAEVFAALLSSELVPFTGAIRAISSFLLNPERRCAGITVLGKIVERCASLLTDKCDSELLGEVIHGLRVASEEAVYQTDIQYIVSRMGWIQLMQTVNFNHGQILTPSFHSPYGSSERILD